MADAGKLSPVFHHKHLTRSDNSRIGNLRRFPRNHIAPVVQAFSNLGIMGPRDMLLSPGIIDIDKYGIGIVIPEICVGVVPCQEVHGQWHPAANALSELFSLAVFFHHLGR